VLLAMGFSGPEDAPWLRGIDVGPQHRPVEPTSAYRTRAPGVFAAGDARRGASLIVWAIREGRDAAAEIHRYLHTVGSNDPAHEGQELR